MVAERVVYELSLSIQKKVSQFHGRAWPQVGQKD